MKLNKIIVINMLVTLGFLSSCNSGGNRDNQVSSSSLAPSTMRPQNSLVIKNGDPVHIPELNALVPLIKIKGKHNRLCSGVFLAPNKVLTAANCVMELHDKMLDQRFESEDLLPTEKISVIFPKKLLKPINTHTNNPSNWVVYHAQAIYVKSDVFIGVNILNNVLSVHDYQGINDLAIIELSVIPEYQVQMELASVAPQVNEEQMIVGFGQNTGNNIEAKEQNINNSGVIRVGKTIVSDITRSDIPSVLRIGGAISNDDPEVIACKGDLGGPSLIYNESSLIYTVTGIVSLNYGINECSTLPSIYMSVAYYKDWIESGYKTDSLKVIKVTKK
ncbi:MAG: hypothetical protein RLZZ293_1188 [Pseudomonadota bacterium]